jgi:C1A family cysteine protease
MDKYKRYFRKGISIAAKKKAMNAKNKIRFYGWKKGTDKPKTILYSPVKHVLPLPSYVDLQPKCPPVYDQGSCTANAVAGLSQYLMRKHGYVDWMPSRLTLYYWNRMQKETANENSGDSLQDDMNSLVKFSVAHEPLWKYEPKNFTIKPEKSVWSDGYWHSVKIGLSVEQNIETIKSCISECYPIIFGMMVYSCFESLEMEKNGILKMPTSNDKILGGHAVMAVGYDDHTKMIKVRNSWGGKWGKNGYFFMPYDYISNPYYCDDFWTAHDFEQFKR